MIDDAHPPGTGKRDKISSLEIGRDRLTAQPKVPDSLRYRNVK